jgi:hypothetical protein
MTGERERDKRAAKRPNGEIDRSHRREGSKETDSHTDRYTKIDRPQLDRQDNRIEGKTRDGTDIK